MLPLGTNSPPADVSTEWYYWNSWSLGWNNLSHNKTNEVGHGWHPMVARYTCTYDSLWDIHVHMTACEIYHQV